VHFTAFCLAGGGVPGHGVCRRFDTILECPLDTQLDTPVLCQNA